MAFNELSLAGFETSMMSRTLRSVSEQAPELARLDHWLALEKLKIPKVLLKFPYFHLHRIAEI